MRACVVALVLFILAFASGAKAQVALTFDDGPSPTLTTPLLDLLEREGVKATFCVVGENVASWPDLVRREHAAGHELCNHSWNHPTLSAANVRDQIERTDAAILAAAGIVPIILRAPYGDTRRVGACYQDRPFVFWDVDTEDWRYRNPERIARIALAAERGMIVLMHDIHATTIEAVPAIIRGFKARGIAFATVSEIYKNPCAG